MSDTMRQKEIRSGAEANHATNFSKGPKILFASSHARKTEGNVYEVKTSRR